MMGHKICFYVELLLIIPKLSLLPLLIWSTAIGCGPYTVLFQSGSSTDTLGCYNILQCLNEERRKII